MAVQSLPSSAEAYTRAQRREIAAAVAAVRRTWRRMGNEFDASFAAIAPTLIAVTTTAQLRVAEGAVGYVPAVLEETGQPRRPVGEVVPRALVGVDGAGLPVESLLAYSTVVAKGAVAEGATAAQALATAGNWLGTSVGTLLSDTGRAAEVVGMANHRVGGYVRMLVPPSCSRCAVLAGRWYSDSVAFQRHPGCDCRHIPASEGVAEDLTVDVNAYFESLSPEEQARVFTKAGAEAIREGADINQVVNARRGMNTTVDASGRRRLAPVRIGGRDVFVTSEGTTRRGYAYRHLSPSRASDVRTGGRYARANRPRMMPETIMATASSREDRLRLLRANGYIR